MEFGISTLVTDDGIRPDALARAVEERGFDALFVAEHSHIPVGSTAPDGISPLPNKYRRTLDPFVSLTAAASVTSTISLGTGIALLPQRDVIYTAKEVASLDVLSHGRVIFGVGSGWNRAEMLNHGTDPRSRGRLMNEQLAALKVIWAEEEAEFHGEFIDFGQIHMWPKPVQRPHPPIYIGGQSPAALARLAAHGDGWFPIDVTPDEVRKVRAALHAEGRDEVTINIAASHTLDGFDQYVEAGIDRAAFHIETEPEDRTLRKLDELAALVDGLG